VTLGLMQPYFAPYLGYFDLINQCDRWVVFDSAQYIRRGWVNRNRLLKHGGGWTYATVPIQYARLDTRIADVKVQEDSSWKQRILGQFDVMKKAAPFHGTVRRLLDESLAQPLSSLSELNVHLLAACCNYLGVRFEPLFMSDLGIPPDEVEVPGDWALSACARLAADTYLNPPGARDLYDSARFAARGVRLRIQEYDAMYYQTPGFAFEANMSILDVLAWNPPEAVLAHLRRVRTDL
jgi:hypothetical protein